MTGNKYIQIIVLNKAELLNYWHSMRIYKVCTFRIWKRVKTDIRESRVLGLNKVTIYHQLYNYHSSLIIKLILAVVYSVQHTCCVTTEIKCFQILRFKAWHCVSQQMRSNHHHALSAWDISRVAIYSWKSCGSNWAMSKTLRIHMTKFLPVR